jgi:hypothetical protein
MQRDGDEDRLAIDNKPLARALGSIALAIGLGGAAIVAYGSFASTARIVPTWPVGRQVLYHLAFRGEGIDAPALVFGATDDGKNPPQRIVTAIDTVLAQTVVANDASGVTLLYTFVEPHVRYRGDSLFDDVLRGTLQENLTHPFALHLARSGDIVGVAAEHEVGALGTGFVRTIASALEIVPPHAGSPFSREWQTSEKDVDGARDSRYVLEARIVNSHGVATIGFHRTSAVLDRAPGGRAGARQSSVSTQSIDDGRWSLEGVLQSFRATEIRSIRVGSRQVGRSQAKIELNYLAEAQVDAAQLKPSLAFANERLASRDATALHVVRTKREIARAGFHNTLGHDDAVSLHTHLVTLGPSDRGKRLSRFSAQLAALFALHPETIGAFEAAVRVNPKRTIAFDAVISALEQAATPPAQRALIDLARARASDRDTGRILPIVLADVADPIAQVDATLLTLAKRGAGDPTGASAFLALGTLCASLRDTEPARANTVLTALEGELERSKTPGDRRLMLLSLGNAGMPESERAIVGYASDASPLVRAAVAEALRAIPTSTADDALANAIVDPDASVRLSAAGAFAGRALSDPSFTSLASAAEHDADRTVRQSATESLGTLLTTRPLARDVLAHIATTDHDSAVRKAAAHAIESAVTSFGASSASSP